MTREQRRDPRYRPELRARAKALYERGYTIREVAAQMGVGRTRVSELLEDAGVKRRPGIRRPKSKRPPKKAA